MFSLLFKNDPQRKLGVFYLYDVPAEGPEMLKIVWQKYSKKNLEYPNNSFIFE
jgi:hypothetical protein